MDWADLLENDESEVAEVEYRLIRMQVRFQTL